MSSNRPYRPPRAAHEELAPRSARPDPRADPDEDGPKPSSPPAMRHSGRMPAVRAPSKPAVEAQRPSQRLHQLEAALVERAELELKHAERVAALEEEQRLSTKRVAELEEENRAASLRVAELEGASFALDRQVQTLGEEARLAKARVRELEQELARKHESEAMLELLAEGQITDKERTRAQTEEIQALRLAVDCAKAENIALQERLGNERAHKERLLDEVARVQTLLDDLKRLAR